MWTRILDRPGVWLALTLAALLCLVPLAWLQYQWIGQISDAERVRRHAYLSATTRRFVQDFDAEFGRIARTLLASPFGSQPELAELAARYARLGERGVDVRLVKHYFVSRGGEDGTRELLRLDPAAGSFAPVPWPGELGDLRARFAAPGGFPILDPEVPALAAPRPLQRGMGRPFRRRGEPPPPAPEGWSVIELDLAYISSQYLPALLRRHFAESGESEYQIRIVVTRDPRRVIYISDPALPPGFFASPDAAAPLLDVRVGQAGGPLFGGPEARRRAGMWHLQVKHRTGSLENVVAETRRRNLAVSLAILSLMAAGLTVLLVSTRRARQLAQIQMEFVAGVSHELRTPLSVICSAADNLADGLVAGEPQVRRYGSVIRGEGRRLSHMVEQILSFAGIQSGRTRYELHPVCVGDVVARAVAAAEPEVRASGCTLESEVDPNLLPILADETSLTHAFRNLLDNAATHGGEGKWIGIRAAPAGNQVEIAVEDRGPGIDPSDASRIFDPFYRGRRALQRQARGFGLGLALARRIVQAHAGSLTLDNRPGKGARFVVRLPVARNLSDSESSGPESSTDRG